MTVGELKEFIEDLDDNLEINVALQPNYPMKGSLENVAIEVNSNGDVTSLWLAASDNEDYGVPDGVWSSSEVSFDDEDEN